MTEDEKAEALRLARKAGFELCYPEGDGPWIASPEDLVRLIALARATVLADRAGREEHILLCRLIDAAKEASGLVSDQLAQNRLIDAIAAYEAVPSPAEPPAAPACNECNGTGYVMRMTYGRGPDDYEQEIECPKCKGTGEPPAAPVQQEPVAWLIDENEPSEFVTCSANIGVHCKGQPLYKESHPNADLRAELDGQELRRAVAQIGVVGQIDGHDVVRRLSVLDIIDRRVK